MQNYFLVFPRKAYELDSWVLPHFTKEQLDLAESNSN
jgi:hypothetical protein